MISLGGSLNKLALVSRGSELTYGQFENLIQSLTVELKAFHLASGSLVWLIVQNNPLSLALYLAMWRIDLAVIAVDQQLGTSERDRLLSDAPPQLLILQENDSLVSGVGNYVRFNSAGVVLERVYEKPRNSAKLFPKISLVQLSSGSTSSAKKIAISQSAILWRAKTIASELNLSEADKTLCTVPISHSHGIDCLVLPTLLSGGTVYLFDPKTAFPYRILDWITRYQITFFSSIPQTYDQFNSIEAVQNYSVTSLRHAFCGSAALAKGTAEKFKRKFGVDLKQGYGLAEIGVITLNRSDKKFDSDSIGQFVQGMQAEIKDDGELAVKAPGLFEYYIDSVALDTASPKDGFLYTGDLVYIDPSSGNLYITGRKNDVINVSGQKLYPREIEDLLVGIQGITNAVVLSQADSERGEVPVLYLESDVVDPGKRNQIQQDLMGHLRQRLADFKLPRNIFWLKQFPKSPLGKVLKSKLKDVQQ